MSNKRQQILDWLEQNRRPEIRIQFKKAEQPLAIGASKIGGCPDVPADFVWPRVQGGGSYGYKDAPAKYQQEPTNYPSPKALMAEYEKCTPEFVSQFHLPPDASDEEVARLVAMAEKEIPNLCQQFEITLKKMQSPSHRQFVYEHHLKNLPQMAGLMKMQHKMMSLFLSDEALKNYENGVIEDDDDDTDDGSVPFDRPLAFMAQFNLSEVADLDKENLLPKSGHLLFFYDCQGLDAGENQDCLKVFYFPPETPLTQMPLPDDMDKDSRIPELQVSFQAGSNVPSSYGVCRHFQHKNFGEVYEILNDEDIARLWEEGRYGCSVTKLLGYADPIQDDMEEQCVLQTLGLDWDDYNNKPEVKAQVDKEKNDWILLFQLDEIDWGNTDWQNTPVDFSGLYEVGDKLPIVGRAFNNYIDEYKAALEQSGMRVIGESQKEKKSFLSSLMGGLFGGKDDTPDDKVEETVENEENDEMTYLCFGDGGCLYVFIRKQDLAAGRFDKVYFEVQSH